METACGGSRSLSSDSPPPGRPCWGPGRLTHPCSSSPSTAAAGVRGGAIGVTDTTLPPVDTSTTARPTVTTTTAPPESTTTTTQPPESTTTTTAPATAPPPGPEAVSSNPLWAEPASGSTTL